MQRWIIAGKRHVELLARLLVLGGLGGCVSQIYYTPLLVPPRPMTPKSPGDVEVFVVTPPSRPHVNVGLFQISEGLDEPTMESMIETLRARAARTGCDGLLITSIDRIREKYRTPSVEGSCVVYKGPPLATKGKDERQAGGQDAAPAWLTPGAEVAPPSSPKPGEGWIRATSRGAQVRSGPHQVAPPIVWLESEKVVWVTEPAVAGWRHVVLSDGRFGYVQDGDVHPQTGTPVRLPGLPPASSRDEAYGGP